MLAGEHAPNLVGLLSQTSRGLDLVLADKKKKMPPPEENRDDDIDALRRRLRKGLADIEAQRRLLESSSSSSAAEAAAAPGAAEKLKQSERRISQLEAENKRLNDDVGKSQQLIDGHRAGERDAKASKKQMEATLVKNERVMRAVVAERDRAVEAGKRQAYRQGLNDNKRRVDSAKEQYEAQTRDAEAVLQEVKRSLANVRNDWDGERHSMANDLYDSEMDAKEMRKALSEERTAHANVQARLELVQQQIEQADEENTARTDTFEQRLADAERKLEDSNTRADASEARCHELEVDGLAQEGALEESARERNALERRLAEAERRAADGEARAGANEARCDELEADGAAKERASEEIVRQRDEFARREEDLRESLETANRLEGELKRDLTGRLAELQAGRTQLAQSQAAVLERKHEGEALRSSRDALQRELEFARRDFERKMDELTLQAVDAGNRELALQRDVNALREEGLNARRDSAATIVTLGMRLARIAGQLTRQGARCDELVAQLDEVAEESKQARGQASSLESEVSLLAALGQQRESEIATQSAALNQQRGEAIGARRESAFAHLSAHGARTLAQEQHRIALTQRSETESRLRGELSGALAESQALALAREHAERREHALKEELSAATRQASDAAARAGERERFLIDESSALRVDAAEQQAAHVQQEREYSGQLAAVASAKRVREEELSCQLVAANDARDGAREDAAAGRQREAELRAKLSAVTAEQRDAAARGEALERRLASMQEGLSESADVEARLRCELESVNRAARESETLVASLSEAKRAVDDRLSTAETNLADLNELNDETLHELKALRAAKQESDGQLNERISSADSSIAHLRSRESTLAQQVSLMESDLVALRSDHRDRESELSERLSVADTALAEAHARAIDQERDFTDTKMRLAESTRNGGVLESRLGEVHEQLSQFEDRSALQQKMEDELQQELAVLQQQAEEGATARALAESERDASAMEADGLRKEVAALRERVDKYDELAGASLRWQVEASMKSGEVAAKDAEVRRLHDENARLAGHQNIKQKIHHLQKLKSELAEMKSRNVSLESQLKTANVQLKRVGVRGGTAAAVAAADAKENSENNGNLTSSRGGTRPRPRGAAMTTRAQTRQALGERV